MQACNNLCGMHFKCEDQTAKQLQTEVIGTM